MMNHHILPLFTHLCYHCLFCKTNEGIFHCMAGARTRTPQHPSHNLPPAQDQNGLLGVPLRDWLHTASHKMSQLYSQLLSNSASKTLAQGDSM